MRTIEQIRKTFDHAEHNAGAGLRAVYDLGRGDGANEALAEIDEYAAALHTARATLDEERADGDARDRTIAELRADLARVTAERDALVDAARLAAHDFSPDCPACHGESLDDPTDTCDECGGLGVAGGA